MIKKERPQQYYNVQGAVSNGKVVSNARIENVQNVRKAGIEKKYEVASVNVNHALLQKDVQKVNANWEKDVHNARMATIKMVKPALNVESH